MRIDEKRLKAVRGSASGWLVQFTGVGDRGRAGWGAIQEGDSILEAHYIRGGRGHRG